MIFTIGCSLRQFDKINYALTKIYTNKKTNTLYINTVPCFTVYPALKRDRFLLKSWQKLNARLVINKQFLAKK